MIVPLALSRKATLLLLALLAPLPASAADEKPLATFSGHIIAGREARHALPQNGLELVLRPDDLGWQLMVLPKARDCIRDCASEDGCYDMASITLPLHGVNATQMEGWHLRNADNTGPNDGSINAPGDERDFIYALNCRDQARIMQSYLCATSAVGAECEDVDNIKVGRVHLTLTGYDLTSVQKGAQAAFTAIDYRVDVFAPKPLAETGW